MEEGGGASGALGGHTRGMFYSAGHKVIVCIFDNFCQNRSQSYIFDNLHERSHLFISINQRSSFKASTKDERGGLFEERDTWRRRVLPLSRPRVLTFQGL